MWAMRIEPWGHVPTLCKETLIKSESTEASHGYILTAHMNEHTLLHNAKPPMIILFNEQKS